MAPNDEPSGGSWGIVGMAAAMVVCCAGLPLLLGAGIAVGAAGLAIGSVLVVAAGAGLALWAWQRHEATRRREPSTPPSASLPATPGDRSDRKGDQ